MCRVYTGFGGALEIVLQPDHGAPKGSEMPHIHSNPTAILENQALDAPARGLHDHFQSTLLSCSPNIRGFATESSFIEVSWEHPGYYILHVFLGYVKMHLYETITERTEKWAAPTFLLVKHSAA